MLEFMRTLGAGRLAAMGAVAAILIGMFTVIILRVTTPTMAPLYTDLSFDDSSAILTQLESMGIEYETRNEGAAILIPQDKVLRTRMTLAGQGLPTGGSVGYEIFDRTDTLGTTSFVQNINQLRALEGELARTIQSISRIVSARVHLVLPKRELFQRDREDPTASIALKVRGTLDSGQIRAIQHLVASAVEGLAPDRVSIVDERGTLLASGVEQDAEGMVSSSLQQRANEVERKLRQQVEEIVSSVVGQGRARVRVAADIDFNHTTETSETYDPDGQVVRSTQSREENSTSTSNEGGVTAGNQLPNANVNQDNAGNRDASNTTEETVNYEISRSTRTTVEEAGAIKRLSVAVLVDGVYQTNDAGELVYAERSQEELDRISTLVRSAVGFDEKRGDKVEVVNLRFAQGPIVDLPASEVGLFDFTKEDILYIAELGVIVLISILLLFFVVRPLVRKVVAEEEKEQEQIEGGEPQMMIAADGSLVPVATNEVREGDEEHGIQWLLDAQKAGQDHTKSVEKIGEIVGEYPNEAVSIVRGWLNEAA
ncbi:flagellar M-ring protein FliF [Breoghania corrubedonensis]|uniref:Flagellar M-ring protein n=1 Tax=Breoghania corrubedonensis TaxID=665038 RepID=A0A2T5UU04_9HYPH|nr:flagellar basal-body MS-ring/collar protein FliF [Breoghania corrubedonensis]PTW54996.1 flagellar M-ring protein FliF [Breoghania corrubedonensis]